MTNGKPAVEVCQGRAGAGDSCWWMAQITSQGASAKSLQLHIRDISPIVM